MKRKAGVVCFARDTPADRKLSAGLLHTTKWEEVGVLYTAEQEEEKGFHFGRRSL